MEYVFTTDRIRKSDLRKNINTFIGNLQEDEGILLTRKGSMVGIEKKYLERRCGFNLN